MHAEPAEVYARFGLSFDPAVPSGGEPGDAERKLAEDCASAIEEYRSALPEFDIPEVLFKKVEQEDVARLAAQFGGGA